MVIGEEMSKVNCNFSEDLREKFELMCECGHKLSHHGFVYNHVTGTLYVSQCVMCGFTNDGKDFVCKEFELLEKV